MQDVDGDFSPSLWLTGDEKRQQNQQLSDGQEIVNRINNLALTVSFLTHQVVLSFIMVDW
jgi:hypothetical protein